MVRLTIYLDTPIIPAPARCLIEFTIESTIEFIERLIIAIDNHENRSASNASADPWYDSTLLAPYCAVAHAVALPLRPAPFYV
jgi:hypothetical protein